MRLSMGFGCPICGKPQNIPGGWIKTFVKLLFIYFTIGIFLTLIKQMVMARSLSFPATLSRNSFMANHTISSICYRSTSSLLSLFPYKIDPFGKTEMFSQNYFMRAPFLSTISWGGCSHSPRYIPIWSGWSTSWWWEWSTSWWRGWWQCLRS